MKIKHGKKMKRARRKQLMLAGLVVLVIGAVCIPLSQFVSSRTTESYDLVTKADFNMVGDFERKTSVNFSTNLAANVQYHLLIHSGYAIDAVGGNISMSVPVRLSLLDPYGETVFTAVSDSAGLNNQGIFVEELNDSQRATYDFGPFVSSGSYTFALTIASGGAFWGPGNYAAIYAKNIHEISSRPFWSFLYVGASLMIMGSAIIASSFLYFKQQS